MTVTEEPNQPSSTDAPLAMIKVDPDEGLVPTLPAEPEEAKPLAVTSDKGDALFKRAWSILSDALPTSPLSALQPLAFVNVPATNTQTWLFWDPVQTQVWLCMATHFAHDHPSGFAALYKRKILLLETVHDACVQSCGML